jgi:hypothetical protein
LTPNYPGCVGTGCNYLGEDLEDAFSNNKDTPLIIKIILMIKIIPMMKIISPLVRKIPRINEDNFSNQ